MKLKVRAGILSACFVLSTVVTACGAQADNAETESVYVEEETTEIADSTEVVAEPQYTEEEREWLDKMMPKVNDSLNVRAEGNQEADLVGRLAKGGLKSLYDYALEKGFTPAPEGYPTKCSLCYEIRKCLLEKERTPDISPECFYSNI